MNTAAKGARFENLCKRRLEAAGWTVTRSAASRGAADLIAQRAEGDGFATLWIQAKSGNARLGPSEWNQLCQAAEMCGAVPVLADKVPGVSAPRFWRLTGLKSGRRGEPQPRRPFDIDRWLGDAA